MSFFPGVLARFRDVLGDDMFYFCSAILVLPSGDPTFAHSDLENKLIMTVLLRHEKHTSSSRLISDG